MSDPTKPVLEQQKSQKTHEKIFLFSDFFEMHENVYKNNPAKSFGIPPVTLYRELNPSPVSVYAAKPHALQEKVCFQTLQPLREKSFLKEAALWQADPL